MKIMNNNINIQKQIQIIKNEKIQVQDDQNIYLDNFEIDKRIIPMFRIPIILKKIHLQKYSSTNNEEDEKVKKKLIYKVKTLNEKLRKYSKILKKYKNKINDIILINNKKNNIEKNKFLFLSKDDLTKLKLYLNEILFNINKNFYSFSLYKKNNKIKNELQISTQLNNNDIYYFYNYLFSTKRFRKNYSLSYNRNNLKKPLKTIINIYNNNNIELNNKNKKDLFKSPILEKFYNSLYNTKINYINHKFDSTKLNNFNLKYNWMHWKRLRAYNLFYISSNRSKRRVYLGPLFLKYNKLNKYNWMIKKNNIKNNIINKINLKKLNIDLILHNNIIEKKIDYLKKVIDIKNLLFILNNMINYVELLIEIRVKLILKKRINNIIKILAEEEKKLKKEILSNKIEIFKFQFLAPDVIKNNDIISNSNENNLIIYKNNDKNYDYADNNNKNISYLIFPSKEKFYLNGFLKFKKDIESMLQNSFNIFLTMKEDLSFNKLIHEKINFNKKIDNLILKSNSKIDKKKIFNLTKEVYSKFNILHLLNTPLFFNNTNIINLKNESNDSILKLTTQNQSSNNIFNLKKEKTELVNFSNNKAQKINIKKIKNNKTSLNEKKIDKLYLKYLSVQSLNLNSFDNQQLEKKVLKSTISFSSNNINRKEYINNNISILNSNNNLNSNLNLNNRVNNVIYASVIKDNYYYRNNTKMKMEENFFNLSFNSAKEENKKKMVEGIKSILYKNKLFDPEISTFKKISPVNLIFVTKKNRLKINKIISYKSKKIIKPITIIKPILSTIKPVISQYLKAMSIYNMIIKGTFIYFSSFIGYFFNRRKFLASQIKNVYKLLLYFFKTMFCLISKPVIIYKNKKIIIHLFYFIILPNFLKNKILRKNYKYQFYMRLWKLKKAKYKPFKYRAFYWMKWRLKRFKRKIKTNIKIDLKKTSVRSLIELYPNKFKNICNVLNKFLKKNIELNLIRLHYPYENSNIFANLLALLVNRIKFRRITRKFFKFAVIKKLKNIVSDKTDKNISAYLTGMNIKVAGRLMRYKVVPKRTVQKVQKGTSAFGKVNYTDFARYTSKNRRGAFSITISTGQNFINN
jgi:hypothetical protein